MIRTTDHFAAICKALNATGRRWTMETSGAFSAPVGPSPGPGQDDRDAVTIWAWDERDNKAGNYEVFASNGYDDLTDDFRVPIDARYSDPNPVVIAIRIATAADQIAARIAARAEVPSA